MPVTDVKILSTGLAAGIIIDATIIRGILAPALVALLGHYNWWFPAPIARLLHTTPLTPHTTTSKHHATSGGLCRAWPATCSKAVLSTSPRRAGRSRGEGPGVHWRRPGT